MRSYYIPDSILPQRYHFSRQDIEKAARDELRQVECLPKSPEPIDLEKYLFRRHDKLEPQYTDHLAAGVLGEADLANPLKPAIWISQAVFDGAPARYRSTLAHEIGHLVLHASLYIDEEFPRIVGSVPRRHRSGKGLPMRHRPDQGTAAGSPAVGASALPSGIPSQSLHGGDTHTDSPRACMRRAMDMHHDPARWLADLFFG
jgi:hypothetical protein